MKFLARIPDHLIGIGVSVLFLLLIFLQLDFFESLELKFYDARAKLAGSSAATDVVVVAIDDDSINKLGRWPWPRSYLARCVDKLERAGAKVIGLDVILSEKEENSGLSEVRAIQQFVSQTGGSPALMTRITEAAARLDNDSKLAATVAASKRVVLPVFFTLAPGQDPKAIPLEIRREAVGPAEGASGLAPARDCVMPIPELAAASAGLGHINRTPAFYGVDGKCRSELLVVDHGGLLFPSLSAKLAMRYLGVDAGGVMFDPGGSLKLGASQSVPCDSAGLMLIRFRGGQGSFPYHSFYDVINDKIAPSAFRGKLVLVGPTALGVADTVAVPTASVFPGVELLANSVDNLIHGDAITRPGWAVGLELAVLLLFGAYLAILLPRLKAAPNAIIAGAMLVVFIGVGVFMFAGQGVWIKLIYPVLQLVIGYTVVTTKRFFVTEEVKEKVQAESAETNRMLGLSFQGQGLLDLAFDKFRKCPVDEGMKDLLYNLALDYERKRMFNKAVAVYEYIQRHDAAFKDTTERIKKLKSAGDTLIFGAAGGAKAESTVMMDGVDTKPTLGRYEIMQELGKGAMGMVYKGRDPKINRIVAIKTIRFSDEFEPEQAKEMKERFFREAELAGMLSHPNIITIYDAGEDYDLSYIAMEFLQGHDLDSHIKPDGKLPARKVIEYVAAVCDALDFAHKQGVVHRDIKPANIMLLESGVVKVTDFGIARATASSKTQTGVILGTPYYMSPEQVAGKRVDGRSDIFSLGVVLYQLLTCKLPFTGDNIATIMFQISQVQHESPKTHDAKLPSVLVKIVDRALEKDPEKRYQTAGEMGRDLRQVGDAIDRLLAQKAGATIGTGGAAA